MSGNRKSQILQQYIIYNLVLIVIPLMIFSIVFFVNTQEQLVDDILSNQQYAIDQAIRDVHQHIDEFQVISTRLSYDEKVTPYQIYRGSLSKADAVKQINAYHSLNNFFELLGLYYFDQDLVLANNGESKLDVFIGYEYMLEGPWDFNDFKFWLTSTSKLKFTARHCLIVKQSNHTANIAIVNPLPIDSGKPFACTMALIRQDYFYGLLTAIVGEIDGAACILDSSGQIMFSASNGMSLNNDIIAESLKQAKAGGSQMNVDGKTCAVTRQLDSTTGWTFLAFFPQNQFFQQFLRERWLALGLIILVVLLGIGMGILIALRNYRPIKKLKQALNSSIDLDKGVGEMSGIHQAVLNISERNRILTQQADQNRALMASNLINCIVSETDCLDTPDFMTKLKDAGISLPGPFYAIAVMRMPRPVISAETDAMINSIYEQSEGSAYGFSIAYNRIIAVLVNFTDESSLDDDVRLISTIAERIYKRRPVIGIGSSCTSISQLNQSLVEAVAAIDSSQISESQIIHFSQLRTWKHKKFWYPTEAQLRLGQAIRHGNRTIVTEAITELSQTLSTVQAEENDIVLRFMVSGCTAQILQLADELEYHPEPDLIRQLVNFRTLAVYIQQLTNISFVLLDYAASRKTDTRSLHHTSIKDFIDQNYARSDLSLSEVAEKFNMTPSSLSKFFRHYEGVNFIEYITTQRINAACELLRNSDMSIKKIMTQVGYNDLASFTRKFRSVIGTSPGKYREMEQVSNTTH